MGSRTSPTKSSTPTKGFPTEKSYRPILKRKSTPGASSLLGSARFSEQEIIQEAKPDMAASFLQFCAMCEKQIMTPCNSILYCSEACRRKDSVKPLTAAIITTTSISPPTSEPPSPRPVLSPRIPTGVTPSPHHSTSSITREFQTTSIPVDLHDHRSDLDPTEWKPKLPERSTSEAFRYLSRFHRSTMSMSTSMPAEHDPASASAPTPSLGTTPTTTASSSLSTSVGAGLAPQYGYGSSHNGYDFSTRPLPTRQNRWYSFNGGTPKGVDLVTPHVVPNVSVAMAGDGGRDVESVMHTPVDDEGLRWEKRKVMFAVPGRTDDGLSVLFAERR